MRGGIRTVRKTRRVEEPIASATGLWEFFINRAGLEPDGWDARFVADLRHTLGLAPAPAGVVEELGARGTSVEQLLVALLEGLEPFGAMLADLLGLFAKAGVRSSGDTAAIVFDFDHDTSALRFDLSEFRRAQAILRQAYALAVVRTWTVETLWRLASALSQPDDDRAARRERVAPEVAAWLRGYEAGGWPQQPLHAPQSGDGALDERIARVWEVWEWVLAQARALAPDRNTLGERWHAQRRAVGVDEVPEDALLELIGMVESDYWLKALAEGASALARRVRTAGNDPALFASIIDRIDAALPDPEEQRQLRETLVRELEDLLDLPFWKHRHALFSAWVLTRILDALAPAEITLHHEDGILRFAFTATHLATARVAEKAISVWSEVRSPLSDPLGSSRVAGIQPDYSLVPGEAEDFEPERSLLEIECKQYKRADARKFAEALADYARGRPRAEIVLTDHGPVDPARVLSRPELNAAAPRAHVIGDFQPGQQQTLHRFALLVRGALWPHIAIEADPPKPPSPQPGLSPMVVRVARTLAPADVELHLFATIGEDRFHVHRGAAGRLHRSPFASHQAAWAPAVEQLRIERQTQATYDIVIHVLECALRGGAVELELSWERQTATLASGWIAPGRWWHAFRINPDGPVLFVDEIRATPPIAS